MANRLRFIRRQRGTNSKRVLKNIKYPNIPLSINDIYAITVEGDRLDLIANQFYSDVRLWWVIVAANPDIIRRDSISLKPGLEIRIPANPNFAVKLFKMINK